MSITTALTARRDALREREAGFTLIELLVVVLIIGILAAIAIPVYLGVQNNAKDAAVKTDLANNKTAIVAYQTANNGTMPTTGQMGTGTGTGSAAATLGSFGWSVTSGATYVAYVPGTGTATTFCVLEKSQSGNQFVITSSTGWAPAAANATTCTAS